MIKCHYCNNYYKINNDYCTKCCGIPHINIEQTNTKKWINNRLESIPVCISNTRRNFSNNYLFEWTDMHVFSCNGNIYPWDKYCNMQDFDIFYPKNIQIGKNTFSCIVSAYCALHFMNRYEDFVGLNGYQACDLVTKYYNPYEIMPNPWKIMYNLWKIKINNDSYIKSQLVATGNSYILAHLPNKFKYNENMKHLYFWSDDDQYGWNKLGLLLMILRKNIINPEYDTSDLIDDLGRFKNIEFKKEWWRCVKRASVLINIADFNKIDQYFGNWVM